MQVASPNSFNDARMILLQSIRIHPFYTGKYYTLIDFKATMGSIFDALPIVHFSAANSASLGSVSSRSNKLYSVEMGEILPLNRIFMESKA